ncbi:MAG: MotA/TolQ/ExbB proton channel family protein [Verrucomicrobiota bacterium]
MGIAACHLSGVPVLGSAFVYAIQESHLPGQIVCAILLLLSTLSWAVMITKFVTVARARRATTRFLETFRTARAPLDIYSDSIRFENAPVYWVYRAGCKELSYQLTGSSDLDEEFIANVERGKKITPSQINSATNAMDRAVGEVGIRLETQMTFLATAVSGAPFLGLLGTVWGVMETFTGIASSSAATSLQDMSPGVSAALVTTVIALLVAIPAMFGYNFLINNIKTLLAEMDNFVAELTSAFERRYRDNFSTTPQTPPTTSTATAGATPGASPTPNASPTPLPPVGESFSQPNPTSDSKVNGIDKPKSESPPPGYYSPPPAETPATPIAGNVSPASEVSPALEEVQDLNELPPPSSYKAAAPTDLPDPPSSASTMDGTEPALDTDEQEEKHTPEPLLKQKAEEDKQLKDPFEDLREEEKVGEEEDDFITGLRSKPGENPLEDILFGDDDDEKPAANQKTGSS